MQIRRASYDEAKRIKEFDVFIGDRRLDNWRGELLVCVADGTVIGFVSHPWPPVKGVLRQAPLSQKATRRASL